jgi:hypothetical protein
MRRVRKVVAITMKTSAEKRCAIMSDSLSVDMNIPASKAMLKTINSTAPVEKIHIHYSLRRAYWEIMGHIVSITSIMLVGAELAISKLSVGYRFYD